MAESTTPPPPLPRTSRSRPCSRCATARSASSSGSAPASRSRGAWSLPGGTLAAGETLERSILRHLATKVDVREVVAPRAARDLERPGRHPERWELATAYLGLVPLGIDPRIPADTAGTRSTRCPTTAFDHGAIVLAGRERLRGKLSYSNIGFALAPETFTLAELRDIYEAALGYEVSRRTSSACWSGAARSSRSASAARTGPPVAGRPRCSASARGGLEVTDPFAVLRPPP